MSKEWIYAFKRSLKVLIDALLLASSLLIAYKLRLDYNITASSQSWFWSQQIPAILGVVVFLRVCFLFIFDIYSKMWRYTEVNELLDLIKPIAFSSLLLSIPRLIGYSANSSLFTLPIGVIVIDSFIGIFLLACARLVRRWQIANRAIKKRGKSSNKARTILIGAGVAGVELSRKVFYHPELDLEIICALDDDPRKQDTKITNDIPILGKINDLEKVSKEHNISQAIIALPSVSPDKLRVIIRQCQEANLETKMIPGVDQLADGQVTVEQIRNVSLEDLLGREPVDLSIPEVSNFINNKTILITGAGGSIGSELTKQLIQNFTPTKVYILGRGENSIFELSQELKANYEVDFTPIICDIRNYSLLKKQIAKVKPDVIFHAAAHKHVPLLEDHPQEAFENNLLGSFNVAEIAGKLNVKTVVNISTDKAVNPINVLGFTKRLAELSVIKLAQQYTSTKYVSVRFGNVIGSRGSVIPTWKFQLKNNLPITVTHEEVSRFFMTMKEAAQLVIKAGAVGNSSEIMVLDMGNEINIFKLAKDFLRLSGYAEIESNIKITGLRPGEKLKEELIGYYEGTADTKHSKIYVIEPKQIDISEIDKAISSLKENSSTLPESDFKNLLGIETKRLNDLEDQPVSSLQH